MELVLAEGVVLAQKLTEDREPDDWLNVPERGVMWGIRLVYALATAFGRWPARLIIRGVAMWYRLFDRKAVRASRDYLRRLSDREPGWWEVYRHLLRFAFVALDRIFLLKGKTRAFRWTRTGHHHLEELKAQKQGAILLGAHLGSFEAMRLGGADRDIPINIVGHFENARMVNALFRRINPSIAARVIHVGQPPIDLMIAIRGRLENGELVAMLADRVGLRERSVVVDFLGKPAHFSAGPFLVAATMKVPIYLTFGIYTDPDRYDLYCIPFADKVVLPRKNRQEALREYVQRYADQIASFCRDHPLNWFNFYDFWAAREDSDAAPDGRPKQS